MPVGCDALSWPTDQAGAFVPSTDSLVCSETPRVTRKADTMDMIASQRIEAAIVFVTAIALFA